MWVHLPTLVLLVIYGLGWTFLGMSLYEDRGGEEVLVFLWVLINIVVGGFLYFSIVPI